MDKLYVSPVCNQCLVRLLLSTKRIASLTDTHSLIDTHLLTLLIYFRHYCRQIIALLKYVFICLQTSSVLPGSNYFFTWHISSLFKKHNYFLLDILQLFRKLLLFMVDFTYLDDTNLFIRQNSPLYKELQFSHFLKVQCHDKLYCRLDFLDISFLCGFLLFRRLNGFANFSEFAEVFALSTVPGTNVSSSALYGTALSQRRVLSGTAVSHTNFICIFFFENC